MCDYYLLCTVVLNGVYDVKTVQTKGLIHQENQSKNFVNVMLM